MEAEPARVSRLVSGFCCSSGQMVPCWRRGCKKIAVMHQRTVGHILSQRLSGVDTAQNAHNGLMSYWGRATSPPLITGMVSEKMTHMVLPSTWIRPSRACTHKGMGGQALHFEAQNSGQSRPRCSADRIHRRKSFRADKMRRDKLVVIAGTETRKAQSQCPCGSYVEHFGGQVDSGSWDRLMTDLFALRRPNRVW